MRPLFRMSSDARESVNFNETPDFSQSAHSKSFTALLEA